MPCRAAYRQAAAAVEAGGGVPREAAAAVHQVREAVGGWDGSRHCPLGG